MTAVADNGGMADELQTAPKLQTALKPKARDLNELVRYTMWSVFRVTDRAALESGGLGNAAAEPTVSRQPFPARASSRAIAPVRTSAPDAFAR